MVENINILYVVLLVGYLVAIAWYVRSTMAFRRSGGEKKFSSSEGRSRRHSKAGKHCPDCKEMIDARRTVCQHCGHKFQMSPDFEPHPDEVRAGLVAAPPPGKTYPKPETPEQDPPDDEPEDPQEK